MKTYRVTARQWAEGWELHIEGEGVTQSRTLAKAEGQVRDWLATMHEHEDFSDAEIVVRHDLGGVELEAADVRTAVSEAAAAQVKAGEQSRAIARKLRHQGLSVADIGTVLGVSRGRVSQLVK